MKSEVNLDAAFGRALRTIREKRGWSQEGFADLCSMDRTYISLLERGKRSPTLRTIGEICRSADISLTELFTIVENFHKHGAAAPPTP